MRIIGIDPGSVVCGYGVIDKKGNAFSVVELGVVNAKKKSAELHQRIKEIYLRLSEVIKRAKPEEAVLETTFYSKNAQSLMKLSHARAAAALAASINELPIFEYSPREVKKSVTGKGDASKEQVMYMIKNLLALKENPHFHDTSDALAIAVCRALRRDAPASSSSSWKDFVKNNPDRVVGG